MANFCKHLLVICCMNCIIGPGFKEIHVRNSFLQFLLCFWSNYFYCIDGDESVYLFEVMMVSLVGEVV